MDLYAQRVIELIAGVLLVTHLNPDEYYKAAPCGVPSTRYGVTNGQLRLTSGPLSTTNNVESRPRQVGRHFG